MKLFEKLEEIALKDIGIAISLSYSKEIYVIELFGNKNSTSCSIHISNKDEKQSLARLEFALDRLE